MKPTYEELKAQVEQLREIINHYQEGQVPSDNAMNELIHRANKIPAQCLADVKEQAVEDCRESYNEALEFATGNRDWDFLDCWIEGDWQAINDEWPEFNLQSEAQLSLMQESGFDTNQLSQQAKK